jgi:hypothetical protein
MYLKRKEQGNNGIGKDREYQTIVMTRVQGMSMENFRNKT